MEDRGPGVPADRLERIFDRFYKADPSRHGGSSGLGLAIAAEHAALLGGELRATNRDGGGLRIELRLPVTGSLRDGDLAAIAADDGSTPNPNPQESQPMKPIDLDRRTQRAHHPARRLRHERLGRDGPARWRQRRSRPSLKARRT